MKCSAEGCERDAMYKAAALCQMHYFRVRRAGPTTKKVVVRTGRFITPNGYIRICLPSCPLACKRGYVFEHRAVMLEKVRGECRACELCGKEETWETCHVDHIDDNRQNNSPDNLRILCRGCNVKRGFKPESYATLGAGLLTFDGKTDTATGWARDPRVSLCGASIARRKRAGMSDFDCLFAEKKTHNGKGSRRNRSRRAA